jgi:hypothetical protein
MLEKTQKELVETCRNNIIGATTLVREMFPTNNAYRVAKELGGDPVKSNVSNALDAVSSHIGNPDATLWNVNQRFSRGRRDPSEIKYGIPISSALVDHTSIQGVTNYTPVFNILDENRVKELIEEKIAEHSKSGLKIQ